MCFYIKIILTITAALLFGKASSQSILLTYDANGNRITKQINSNLPVGAITGDSVYCKNTLAQLTAAGGSSYQWIGGPAQPNYSFIIDTTREFTVIVTKGPGCKDTVTKLIKAVPPPAAVNISGDSNVAINQLVTYTIPPVSSATNYVWAVTNGSVVSGNGTNSVIVKWQSAPGSGNISVAVFIGTGCSTTMPAKSVFISNPNSIEKVFEGDLNIYPNPSSEGVHVALEAPFATRLMISVRNCLGKVIYESPTEDLRTGHYVLLPREVFGAAGIYTVSCKTDQSIISRNIIITD